MPKIFLNAGHDAKRVDGKPIDCGAINVEHQLFECDVCETIAKEIEYQLKAKGYEAISRQDDDLDGIVKETNQVKPDAFVSIHCNACKSHLGQGTETYYSTLNPKWSEIERKTRALANAIQRNITRDCGTYDRGVKDGALYVCKRVECPSVLVECGFIDNENDYKLLDGNPQKFATAIVKGIVEVLCE